MKDTYEFGKATHKLELKEWDDIWFDDNHTVGKKRVLILGDSISRGIRHKIAALLKDKAIVDNAATSKAVDNPSLLTLLSYIKEQVEYDIIQINNGLHGWHLSLGEYEKGADALILHIKKLYPEAKIIVALTTPVRSKADLNLFDERNETVIGRNEILMKLAKKYDADTTDLYSAVAQKSEVFACDGVHYLDEGYNILSEKVKGGIEKYL